MEIQTIMKSVEIKAPKEKVFNVLVDDSMSRIWYAEFMEGTHAVTDWKEGSPVSFIDGTNNGIIGRVIANKPGELLSVEYDGFIKDGAEDYESEGAKATKGSRETYHLSEKNGVTTLDIESDMGSEYFEMMSKSWDKALEKIKALAEK
jgi:uncharacterized protein YndB with AHSA1/START domain